MSLENLNNGNGKMFLPKEVIRLRNDGIQVVSMPDEVLSLEEWLKYKKERNALGAYIAAWGFDRSWSQRPNRGKYGLLTAQYSKNPETDEREKHLVVRDKQIDAFSYFTVVTTRLSLARLAQDFEDTLVTDVIQVVADISTEPEHSFQRQVYSRLYELTKNGLYRITNPIYWGSQGKRYEYLETARGWDPVADFVTRGIGTGNIAVKTPYDHIPVLLRKQGRETPYEEVSDIERRSRSWALKLSAGNLEDILTVLDCITDQETQWDHRYNWQFYDEYFRLVNTPEGEIFDIVPEKWEEVRREAGIEPITSGTSGCLARVAATTVFGEEKPYKNVIDGHQIWWADVVKMFADEDEWWS